MSYPVLQDWEQKKQQGIEQIHSYLQLTDIQQLDNLKSYLILSNGDALEMIEVMDRAS